VGERKENEREKKENIMRDGEREKERKSERV
jgi:hypothetical protein